MNLIKTPLQDCFIFEPQVFEDERGYFFESFNEQKFRSLMANEIHFVQDNQSYSGYGVIRGLHAQKGNFAQSKLVRVLQGEILDVAVDMRPDSKTFKQHFSIHLSEENKKQLFVPKGFLHGFSVLSKTAVVFYKCDEYYHKAAETGIRYNDEDLNIDWKIPNEKQIISQKDIELNLLKDLNDSFLTI